MDWLADAARAFGACRDEQSLCDAAARQLRARLSSTPFALSLVRSIDERMVCVYRSGAGSASDPGAPFDPDSALRALLYSNDLAPGGSGAAHANLGFAWPFDDGPGDALWVTLRAGPEIIGCLTIDTPMQAPGMYADHSALVVFADVLAMHVQTMRLRNERDGRIEELDASIRRLTVEQNWLQATSTSITGCRTVAEVVDLTYEAVRHGLGFDRVAIFLLRDVHQRQTLVEMAGTTCNGDPLPPEPDGLAVDSPDLATIAPDLAHLLAGNPYFYCPDRWAITLPEHRQYLDGRMREQIVVAIRCAGRLLGTISADNTVSGRTLPESRAEVLVTFAQQVGTALENARLIEAEAQARDRAEALLRASMAMNGSIDQEQVMQIVARETRQALRAATCELFLYDDQMSRTIAHFMDGYTVAEVAPFWDESVLELPPSAVTSEDEMIRTMSPVLIDVSETPPINASLSAALGTTSRLLVPLILDRDGTRVAQGALYVNYAGKFASEISKDDIELATAMAGHAAVALEHARLFADEQKRAKRLQEVDDLRREFLATVSHELRTPLTGVIGFAETLTYFWDHVSDERRLATVDKILASAHRLERLVLDLLLASRIEDAQFSVRLESVDALGAVLTATDEIRAKYREQLVTVEMPDAPLFALGDSERLCQILVNLLDNAVKYSPEGAEVAIRVGNSGERVTFEIEDTGPGIARVDMARLFERFGKLGHAARAGSGGTGLGLYICRHLARAMGGDVQCDSTPGKGSVFTLDLSLAERRASKEPVSI